MLDASLADPKTREAFAAFLGRDPHPSGAAKDIYHIRNPKLPQYRFEWHPKLRKVYLVRVGSNPEVGELMAFNVETHGDAHNAVLIWLRGFHEGRTPDLAKPHLQI